MCNQNERAYLESVWSLLCLGRDGCGHDARELLRHHGAVSTARQASHGGDAVGRLELW